MVDYFDAPGTTGGNNGTDGTAINGAAPAAANGEDLGMDEISVTALCDSFVRRVVLLIKFPPTVNPGYRMCSRNKCVGKGEVIGSLIEVFIEQSIQMMASSEIAHIVCSWPISINQSMMFH